MPHSAAGSDRAVYVVLPGDVDDPARISGGNVYGRRMRTGLADLGWRVSQRRVAGAWPQPDVAACRRLAATLAALPDGSRVLLDGLVACGVPQVLTPHAGRLALTVLVHLPLAEERGRSPALARRLNAAEGAALAAATTVVAASPWAARRLVDLHGLSPDRVHVVPPGTDPAALATGTDGVSRLLCVGSVTPTKGQDLFVEALARVADRTWVCALVGPLHRDPAHVDAVRAAIDRYGLGDRIRLPGPLTPDRLAAVYDVADLVVAPSRVETFGMAAAEALARGIPVVASAVGGLPGTVGYGLDGDRPGILVAPDDVDALASALRRWLGDAALRDRLRRSARERRSGFAAWPAVSRQLSDLLEAASPAR